MECGMEMARQASIRRKVRRGGSLQEEPSQLQRDRKKRPMGPGLKPGVDYTNGIGQKQWEFWTRPLFDDGQGKQMEDRNEERDEERRDRRRDGDAGRASRRGRRPRQQRTEHTSNSPDMLTCVPTRDPSEFRLGHLPMPETGIWADQRQCPGGGLHQADTPTISNLPHNQEKGVSSLTAWHPPGQQYGANAASDLEADTADSCPDQIAGDTRRGHFHRLTVPEQESNSSANNAIFNDDKGDNPLEINSSAPGVDSSGENCDVRAALPGLAPPVMDDQSRVTGLNKERHRVENKRKRRAKQVAQGPTNYWTAHAGKFKVPPATKAPTKYRGQMCPSGLASHHPAAELRLDYSMKGCPTKTGAPWTKEQMQEAIDRGPHETAMDPLAIEQLATELEAKVKKKQCKVVLWDDIKHNPPKQLKISPLAMIPHKSRMFRAILDLSFNIRLKSGEQLMAVNESSEKTAPKGAIDQLGHSLQRIIHAFAQADEKDKVFMAKWDIKDGFWRLDCQEGEEWNFAYVLPQEEGQPVRLVVPTSLQMGWIESPPFFCAASETGRDVAAQYIETPVGSLSDHKFVGHSTQGDDFKTMDKAALSDKLSYLVEVYVDDYISLVVPRSKEDLKHVANAVLQGIHDVFPSDKDDAEDPISLKKLVKLEAMWALHKDILGFTFDGVDKTIWLEEEKRNTLLTVLKGWLRASRRSRAGVPLEEFQSIIAKLRHAFISIPSGKGLLSPCNRVIRRAPPVVYLHRNKALQQAIADCRTMLRESTLAPTKCTELVMGWPDFVGVKDASGHGVGGVIIGEGRQCVPTVFRFEWPQDIKDDLVSKANPTGRITNSDLEMAGLLMLWLVMEDVCDIRSGSHVALFSDNQPTVHWVQRMAAKNSLVAAQLVRALALRLKKSGASPLTPLHIAGVQNAMTDIPSRSFGSEAKWHCKTDCDLLQLFNSQFPLPKQNSWTVYRPSKSICTKVLSVLRMQVTSMDVWRRLPKAGRHTGAIGSPSSRLWEWTLSYRESTTPGECDASQGSPASRGRDTLVEENKSKVQQFLGLSRPLARRSPWPRA